MCASVCVGMSMLEQEARDLPCPLINTLPTLANRTPVVSLVMWLKFFTLRDDSLSIFPTLKARQRSVLWRVKMLTHSHFN